MEAEHAINKLLKNPPKSVGRGFNSSHWILTVLFFEILTVCPEKMRFRGITLSYHKMLTNIFPCLWWKSCPESLAVLRLDVSHCFLHLFFFFFFLKLACNHQCLFPSHQSASPHPAAVCLSKAKSVLSLNWLQRDCWPALGGTCVFYCIQHHRSAILSFSAPRLISEAIIFNPWQQDEDKSLSMYLCRFLSFQRKKGQCPPTCFSIALS